VIDVAVRQIKSEKRCKICASPDRIEIDRLLELRSVGEKIDGVRVTGDYVLARMGELGLRNPTLDNLKAHWKNHCEVVSDELVGQLEGAVTAALEALDQGATVDPDAALDRIVAAGMAEIEQKIRNGQKVGISVDHILKAIDSKTRRGHTEAQSELLRSLGGGIESVFKKALGGGEQKQLPEVVEDAEFEEVA
jgi:hypothetical protein